MSSFLAAFAIYVSICSWIWAILNRLEKVSKDDFLKEISERINKLRFGSLYFVFIRAIDKAFRFYKFKDRFYLPKFKNSILCTLLLSVSMLVVAYLLHGHTNGIKRIAAAFIVVLLPLPFTILTDYLSFAKSRTLLLSDARASFWKYLGLVLLDGTITILLSAVSLIPILLISTWADKALNWIVYGQYGSMITVPGRGSGIGFLYDDMGINSIEFPGMAVIYSVWTAIIILLLSVIYRYGMPVLLHARAANRLLRKIIDVQKYPLDFIAIWLIMVSTVLFLILYCVAALVHLIF